MRNAHYTWILLLAVVLLLPAAQLTARAADQSAEYKDKVLGFGISRDVGDAASRQAGEVRQQIANKARSLFKREPLGFD